MPTSEREGRIAWIDVAKGYAMLCVIAAHIGAGGLGTLMYTFHLPIFFFLSGFLFRADRPFPQFLRRKAKTMLLPYFALGGVVLLFFCLQDTAAALRAGAGGGGAFLASLLKNLAGMLVQRRWGTIWFLGALFLQNLLFFPIVRLAKTPARVALCGGAVTILGLLEDYFFDARLPWNADVAMTAAVFFGVGYFIHAKYERIRAALSSRRATLLFLALGVIDVVCLYLSLKLTGTAIEFSRTQYGFPPLAYLSSFAGVFCLVLFSHRFTPRAVRYVGRNSLLYFAWHQNIAIPLAASLLSLLGMGRYDVASGFSLGIVAYRALQFALVLAMCTLANELLTRTRARVLLGR